MRALVRAFVDRGLAALTFVFRGAGESQGEIEGSTTEWGDVTRALDALEDALPPGTPLALAGYSFGAWCACNVAAGDPRVRAIALVAPGASMPATLDGRPIAIAHPENDHITHPQVLADWLQSIGGGELAVIHGADHYLRDRAGEVSDYLGDFLARALTTSDNASARHDDEPVSAALRPRQAQERRNDRWRRPRRGPRNAQGHRLR